MKPSTKLGIAATALTAFALVSPGCTRVTERDIAVKTTWGNVDKEYERGAGLSWYIPIMQSINKYSLYVKSFTIEANHAHLMTKDNQPITGAITIQFRVKDEKGSAARLYKDFNYTDSDAEHVLILSSLSRDASVAVFGQQPALGLTEHIDNIMKKIQEDLQSKLNEKGVPIEIFAVNSSGIGLSPESVQKLEGLMLEQQRASTLQVREANAERAKIVAEKEVLATAVALKALRDSGLSGEQALIAYCLQLSEKEGSVNKPLTPGCMGNNRTSAITVAPPK